MRALPDMRSILDGAAGEQPLECRWQLYGGKGLFKKGGVSETPPKKLPSDTGRMRGKGKTERDAITQGDHRLARRLHDRLR